MSVIDQSIIESALRIRAEYFKATDKVVTYENDVKKLSDYLVKVASELTDYNNTQTKNVSIEDTKKYLLGKMDEIDGESKSLLSKITPLNEKIESLRIEWDILYAKIKEKYPDISDEIIISELGIK